MRFLILIAFLTGSFCHAQSLNLFDLPFLANASLVVDTNGLIAWWKADSFNPLGLTNNAPIGNTTNGTQWINLAPSSNTQLVQSNASVRPLFLTNQFTNSFGQSMPAISFNGNTHLEPQNSVVLLNTNFTILAVVKQASGNDGCVLGNLAANNQFRANRLGANTWSFFDGTSERVSLAYGSAQTALKLSTFFRVATTNGILLFDNITNKGPTNAAPNSVTVNEMGRSDGGGGLGYSGLICEVLIYNRALTDAQFNALYTNYIRQRWPVP